MAGLVAVNARTQWNKLICLFYEGMIRNTNGKQWRQYNSKQYETILYPFYFVPGKRISIFYEHQATMQTQHYLASVTPCNLGEERKTKW